jgi:uncharacterized protein YecE (DUF72 family)
MDFGKLPSVYQVDFRLPSEPPQNEQVLSANRSRSNPNLYIGPTGYNMKPWVGKWYPPGAVERHFLRHYGAQFNTIEHNTTHYRIPDLATIERWRTAVPPDFRFCPKIPQSISHAADLGRSTSDTAIFCEHIAALGTALGPCFMQLPPHFGPRDLLLLEQYISVFPKNIPLAIEVRHPSFFADAAAGEAFFDLLQAFGMHAVITDVAGRRDVAHMRLASATVLIRFVGNGLHPSDYERVKEWSARLAIWFEQGLEAAYFFTHEPDNLLAPELAAYCHEVFSAQMPQVTMRGPQPVAGQQGSLF